VARASAVDAWAGSAVYVMRADRAGVAASAAEAHATISASAIASAAAATPRRRQ
jgi:hypothetical protein